MNIKLPWRPLVEKPLLDSLYGSSSAGKTYLGCVRMTDYTDMINTRPVTIWQQDPSSKAKAQSWAEGQPVPQNCVLDSRVVVSVAVDLDSVKTRPDRDWFPPSRPWREL